MNRLSNGRAIATQWNLRARLRRTGVALAAAMLCGTVAPQAHALNKAAKKPADTVAAMPADAVASVNGVPVTQTQVDEAVRASKAADTPALRAAMKNQLIARELFRQAALKQHYDTRPQVVAAVEQAKTLAMTQAYLHDQVKPAPVPETDIRARYDAIVAGSARTNTSRARLRSTTRTPRSRSSRASGRRGLRHAGATVQQGAGCRAGGALNWISFKTPIEAGNTQNWPQPLAEALVKLPQGGLTREPVQVGDAYWILRVDDKRATQVPSFDQAKDMLRQQLEQVAMEKATAQVVVDLIRNARIQQ